MTQRTSPAARLQDAAAPTHLALDLRGAGLVGGAFLRLAEEAGIPVAAVHRRRGVELRDAGLPTVLVDATPPRFEGPAAEAWVALLERTLRAGTPVVTCNKAPLAIAWKRLAAAAHAGKVPLLATATVGGGTPVLAPLVRLHAGRGVASVEATLSGTLGFVLPRVKAGASLQQAVAEAKAAGFCEPDERLDLDGTDAWGKACILHNALWPGEAPVTLQGRPAPLRLQESAIRALAHPAVVARLAPGRAELFLQDWPALPAAGLFVRARTLDGEAVQLTGPGAGSDTTARALLADVLAVSAGTAAPGIGATG